MQVHDHLPLEELQRLAEAITNKRIWRRHQAIILAHQGRDSADIALALACSQRAVQVWLKKYNEVGPDSLTEKPHTGRPPRVAGPDVVRFRQRVEAGPRPDENRSTFYGHDYQRILRDEFGVTLSLPAVYDLLHRHGFASLMPRPQHKDADEELERIFREVVVDPIQAIREAHPEADVGPYFEDEGRFGQQGTLCRVWASKGSRPRGVKQTQYKSLHLLTAVCPSTGESHGLISALLNVEVINLLLRQLSEEMPAGRHAALIWDGAGYHTSPLVVVPSNISLIQLVPYSPELNPVENLWHYLRSHYCSLRVFANIDVLEEEMMLAWRAVCLDEERMRSICAAPYVQAT